MSSKFEYTNLDSTTRRLMSEEIALAEKTGELYFSSRFTQAGHDARPALLDAAAKENDEHRLAYNLEVGGFIKGFETKAKPGGGYTVAHVPDTAAETFADGQFTRFYIAAVCRRTLEEGRREVTVYRAKSRGTPRAESRALEGQKVDAEELLTQVRSRQGSLACPSFEAEFWLGR